MSMTIGQDDPSHCSALWAIVASLSLRTPLLPRVRAAIHGNHRGVSVHERRCTQRRYQGLGHHQRRLRLLVLALPLTLATPLFIATQIKHS
eukprot:165332-Pleurochrysis_carterae.AAC.1